MPVKISAKLVEAARSAADKSSRSLTAQIEHWSLIGRQAEKILAFEQIMLLKSASSATSIESEALSKDQVMGIINCIDNTTNNSDRSIFVNFLHKDAGPVYETDPNDSSKIRLVAANGSRISGRMINRQFVQD